MVDQKTIQYYDREASRYAAATAKHSMNEPIGRFTALLPGDALILDLGCGGGRDLTAFSRRAFDAVGLDAAFELAKIARMTSGRPVTVGDILELPFKENSFDAVWASASLLHLRRKDIDSALAGIRNTLVSGGLFFSSMKMGDGENRTDDSRFFTYFMPSEWEERLARAGFELIESQYDPIVSLNTDDRWMNTIARSIK
jgi:SAM-dependent methyltransferase